MKYVEFTPKENIRPDKFIRMSVLSVLFLILSFGIVEAQCPLICNDNVQVSLDDDCQVEVTPSMVLEGEGPASCNYVVAVLDNTGVPIPGSPFVTGAYIGQTLTVRVSLGANTCWGSIAIEDKLPPVIACPGDITLECYETDPLTPPSATDNCDGSVEVETISDVFTDLDCTEPFSAQRILTYRAVDNSGNISELCVRVVSYNRITLADVVFPPDYDDVDLEALQCDEMEFWDTNTEPGDQVGYPDVSETGVPASADGTPFLPNNTYCEINATFSDQKINVCESTFKVLRTWTILDWCTGDIEERHQVIKVEDDDGPEVECSSNDPYVITAHPYQCVADWDVVPPVVTFDCSSTSYRVSYLHATNDGPPPANGLYVDYNVVSIGNGYRILNLPLGTTWIKYTVTDACGNFTDCFTEVEVLDDVAPVAICDQFTVATLSTNGTALVYAGTFDDGSYDNCSQLIYEARRMTGGCEVDTTEWSGYVRFCCEDLGEELMVALRVTDESGNSNTCMVMITVQDKLNPIISCPPDITLDCGEDHLDLSITGEAAGYDNCGDPDVIFVDTGSLNQCGQGTIFRRWTATDGGGRTDQCVQRIDIIDDDPFTGSDILWPSDITLAGCMDVDTDPNNTGFPTYVDDECSLIAHSYSDEVFEFVDDVCFKILRTWTVLDWCQFDQNNPTSGGIWQKTQIIKVNNTIAPVFTGCTLEVPVCIYGDNCQGEVTLINTATDDCTPEEELAWSYTIDVGNDGTIEYTGNTNDASRVLSVGPHKIEWRVEDRCGNQSICEIEFEVEDCKKPTPYCISDITTVIMPSSGQIQVWASDFDFGSFDNCPGDLHFSFSSNTDDTAMTFTCDDKGLNTVQIWVTDAHGNQDFCETQINIQSNNGVCDDNSLVDGISGLVRNENNTDVTNVLVALENMSSHEMSYYLTIDDGTYAFGENTASMDYEISASRNDDYRNGVSTLDLVIIQRHILGLETFESPYKVIAADVDNNESVSGADIVTLRKLILSVFDEFPNNSSWRFVDSEYEFNDVTDPWGFSEVISVENFDGEDLDNNFIGVKIGDVNNSAVSNGILGEETDTRSGNPLILTTKDKDFQKGEQVKIEVRADQFKDILGYQFTVNFDPSKMEYVDVESGTLPVTEENIGLSMLERGYITTSWSQAMSTGKEKEGILFTMIFDAKSDGNVMSYFDITSEITEAEAYTTDLNAVEVLLDFHNDETAVSDFTLMQNRPNPFRNMTNISFILEEDADASLTIMDITGKVVKSIKGNFEKGLNTIELLADELSAEGVLYYQLESNGYRATRKMIVLRI